MGLTIYDTQGRPKRSVRGPDVAMDPWHLVGAAGEPAFQNSWSSTGGAYGPAGFRKFPDGKVAFKGVVSGGASNSIMFTLPVGYRPAVAGIQIPLFGDNGAAGNAININNDGSVYGMRAGGSLWLHNVEFDTESVAALPGGPMGPISTPPRVTVLPTAPYDGQEIYYVADAANGLLWHLKYNAAGGTYKWEVVGGSSLFAKIVAAENRANAAYGDLATPGPQITVPLAGEYRAANGAFIQSSVAGVFEGWMTTTVAGGGPIEPTASFVATAQFGAARVTSRALVLVTPAGAAVKASYSTQGGLTMGFSLRWLDLMPVRVG